jgi:hypothetical protein
VPALLGPLIGFALGVALGWVRAAQPDARGAASTGTAVSALFGALVFAPVNAYFLAFAGDWSFAYFLDSRDVPSALLLVLVLLDGATVPAGFAAAMRRARARSLGSLMVLGAAPAGIALVALLVCHQRLRVDATYQQYRLDFGTEPVAGGSLGYALLWMVAMLTIGFVITQRALRLRAPAREGRHPPDGAPGPMPEARLGAPRRL